MGADWSPDSESRGFFYVSAYNLAPYSDEYVEEVFKLSAQTGQPGIVYSNLNRDRYPHEQQLYYNRMLYNQAVSDGADVWMQLRLFDNGLGRDGSLYNARQLVKHPKRVLPILNDVIDLYSNKFEDCKIILFEEAGIYHSPQGGGDFWAGGNKNYTGGRPVPAANWDRLFAYRFTEAFNYLADHIRERTHCDVGYHIGHTALYREYGGMRVIEHIASATDPNFIVYDLYPSASPDYQSYANKLSDRIPVLAEIAPTYYLNQMHTMNNFAHGGGQTPSAGQMRESVALAYSLGAERVGWYTKNAQSTVNMAEAFNPNTQAQKTALESSRDRFLFALGLTAIP